MEIALVTGGSKGIGLYTVLGLVNSGYKVITCSRSQATWLEAIKTYSDLKSVDYLQADLSKEDELKRLFEYIKTEYGRLDVAVNNASPQIASLGNFHEIDDALLKGTLDIDFWAQAQCLKCELNLMQEGASIVNVSSINGLRPTPSASMYSASKHALEGLTRSLALENIKRGIRVNSVAPGVTWTPRWEETALTNPNVRSEVSEVVPLKRFGHIHEVVNAIEFLLSSKASYIVGHTLVVDGGLSLRGG